MKKPNKRLVLNSSSKLHSKKRQIHVEEENHEINETIEETTLTSVRKPF